MRKQGGFAAFVTAIFAGAALWAALCPPAWAVDKKQVLDEKLMDRVRAIEAGLDGVLRLDEFVDLEPGKKVADGNPAIAAVAKRVYGHFSRLRRSSEHGRVGSEK